MTARIREAATSRGDARTAARLALTEALRFERWPTDGPGAPGYLCADGTRAPTLRAAVRSWTAAATGRIPGHPGRPKTRVPDPPRAPKAPRTSVTVRLPEDVLAWCREHGGVTAAVERSVRAAMVPTWPDESMTDCPVNPRLFRQEIMAEPPRTHEDFACEFCGKPVPIGDWPIVHDPRRTWATGWPCCSEGCAREMASAGGMVRHLTADDHDRAWMRRRLLGQALGRRLTGVATPPAPPRPPTET